MRIRIILLTGDTKAVAAAVAHSVEIGEFEANLLPEDKLGRIKDLVSWPGRRNGRRRHQRRPCAYRGKCRRSNGIGN